MPEVAASVRVERSEPVSGLAALVENRDDVDSRRRLSTGDGEPAWRAHGLSGCGRFPGCGSQPAGRTAEAIGLHLRSLAGFECGAAGREAGSGRVHALQRGISPHAA